MSRLDAKASRVLLAFAWCLCLGRNQAYFGGGVLLPTTERSSHHARLRRHPALDARIVPKCAREKKDVTKHNTWWDDCQKLKPHLKGLIFESLEATAFFRQRVRVWRNGVLEGDPHDLDPRKVDLVRSSIISKNFSQEFLPRRRNSKYITLFFSPLSGPFLVEEENFKILVDFLHFGKGD